MPPSGHSSSHHSSSHHSSHSSSHHSSSHSSSRSYSGNRSSHSTSHHSSSVVSARSNYRNNTPVRRTPRTRSSQPYGWNDSQTDCWFYFNDDVSPYQWQYWYEGISSDYGDYGWMEYDMGEEAWYIEADEGDWVHLPSEYDTSGLWHMTDEYTNSYE